MPGSILKRLLKSPGQHAKSAGWQNGKAPEGARWSRIVMEREIRRLLTEIHPENLSCLEIAGETYKDLGWKKFQRTNYPEYDVTTGPLPGGETFDCIIANQVWEHLLWPLRAARHVHQMLNPGGYFLISTPFLIRVHNYPVDCTRWTELGLKHFLAEAGFPLDPIQTGAWGNRACVVANFDKFLSTYDPKKHSLENEPNFPYHVWALAKKEDNRRAHRTAR
jgi:SAM-dependent methyltransferase